MAKPGGRKATPKAQGALRQSQLLTSYGPGAMLDLPHHAAVVACVDDWRYRDAREGELKEPRLEALVNRFLAGHGGPWGLRQPPTGETKDPYPYVAAYRFPDWFVVQKLLSEAELARLQGLMLKCGPRGKAAVAFTRRSLGFTARPLVGYKRLVDGLYVDEEGGGRRQAKHQVVPVRFAQSCFNNHLSDVDWPRMAHRDHGKEGCFGANLVMLEDGSSGALDALVVACLGCGAHMALARAADEQDGESNPLGLCRSISTWLGSDRPDEEKPCESPEGKRLVGKLIARNAAHQHFPQILRVLSLPDGANPAGEAVDACWSIIQNFTSAMLAQTGPLIPDVAKEMKKVSEAAFLAAFEAKLLGRDGLEEGPLTGAPKPAELEALLAAGSLPRSQKRRDPNETWVAERLEITKESGFPKLLRDAGLIDRVVLVHRLREVSAMVGFTRFDPVMPDIQGELDLNVPSAPIFREARFVPAVETWGEGVALILNRDAVEAWAQRPAAQARWRSLSAGFGLWKKAHPTSRTDPPTAAYTLLHSLAHLLMQTLALRCGYPVGGLKERIYALPDLGYGLLIYTAASDAAGTMGGLVGEGQRFGEVLQDALRLGEVCSNDPLCALHDPSDADDDRKRQGAACHGCAMIPEPSCERMNEDLDRALVVETMELGAGPAFFTW